MDDLIGFTLWGRDRRDWQPETCRYYRARVLQASAWLERHRDVTLEAATTSDLLAWLADTPAQPKTRNTYRAALVAYFDWLQTTGLRRDNPARDIDRIRERPTVPRALTAEAMAAIVATASAGPRRDIDAMVHLMAYGGLRIGEVARLEWANVEGDWLRVTGKGARTRMVPIHPELRASLNAWSAVSTSAGWMFPSPRDASRHMSTGAIRAAVKRVAEAAGYPGVVPHQARHTFATRLLEEGVDLATIQGALGHARIATTTVYLRVRPERMHEAVTGMRYAVTELSGGRDGDHRAAAEAGERAA